MSDKDLFEDDKGENKLDTDLTKGDEENKGGETVDQLLKSIVDDDGKPKYANEAEAIKALVHSQSHIKTLESDNAVLKDKGNASEKLDELLAAVKKSQDGGQGDSSENASTLKPEDVLGIVKEYLDDSKAADSRTNNIKAVTGLFKERYGKDASEKLYGTANDLGLNRSEINAMIATNPTAALKILGVEVNPQNKVDAATLRTNVDASNFRQVEDAKPKSIMGISSSKDLTDEWKASQQRTLKRLGIES